ncbi:TIGR02757 family protein [bacterium]|nr:TIGR02757 family protein [candidate division CSSED10-310 bacterium]
MIARIHLKKSLDDLYDMFNRRDYVHPDPVEFLYRYEDVRDRELAGLFAACLAFGRVVQINKSVERILDIVESPRHFVEQQPFSAKVNPFAGFKHRFVTGKNIQALWLAIKKITDRFGSLEFLWRSLSKNGELPVETVLGDFCHDIRQAAYPLDCGFLVPNPAGNSAFKRINLFLKWMSRHDAVDPGGWNILSPSQLIVPLDTHVHRFAMRLGMTCRRAADLTSALEITDYLSELNPSDPVKYDFIITRAGMNRQVAAVFQTRIFNSSYC